MTKGSLLLLLLDLICAYSIYTVYIICKDSLFWLCEACQGDLWSRLYLNINASSEPGRLATLPDSPLALARDLVPSPENKRVPSLWGRVLTDAGIGG